MRFPLATRYNDYDTKGHVNNAVFLTYFEMARERAWVDGLGGNADFPFILAEASVQYRSEAMIGDPLEIAEGGIAGAVAGRARFAEREIPAQLLVATGERGAEDLRERLVGLERGEEQRTGEIQMGL